MMDNLQAILQAGSRKKRNICQEFRKKASIDISRVCMAGGLKHSGTKENTRDEVVESRSRSFKIEFSSTNVPNISTKGKELVMLKQISLFQERAVEEYSSLLPTEKLEYHSLNKFLRSQSKMFTKHFCVSKSDFLNLHHSLLTMISFLDTTKSLRLCSILKYIFAIRITPGKKEPLKILTNMYEKIFQKEVIFPAIQKDLFKKLKTNSIAVSWQSSITKPLPKLF